MTPKQLSRLTKAQLIKHIHELEQQTLKVRLDNFVAESRLLAEDLYKVTQYVYCLGVKARKALDSFNWSILQHEAIEINTGKSTLKFDLSTN